MTVRGRGEAQLLAALAAVAALAAAGCSNSKDETPFARIKTPAYHEDSARVVRLATRALGDSIPMRVESVTKGNQGWFVRLLPTRGGDRGGGTVWVELADSSATVVKRY
ncbi:MAG: hypothetical protein HOQ09_11090 [Gemmatimonadaceae bacterium]|nr:hypothetical protein [Gemmatimonadaceae bacterium]